MTAAALPSAARRPLRRILHALHLWIGLVLGIPLVVIGLSGSVLVFEDELREWLEPAGHAVIGEPRPLGDILLAAQAAAPAGTKPLFVSVPGEPKTLATVRFAAPGAAPGPGGIQVQVDPVSLGASARPANAGWLRQMFNLHAQLFVPGRDGRRLVGWFGVAMVALGISGMVMWWPRSGRWTAAFAVDRRARGARFLREVHRVVGIWCWLVFMAVSVSSVYLAFPQTLGDAVRRVLPGRDLRLTAAPRVTPAEGVRPLDIDGAVALVRSELPDAAPRLVALPQRADQPFRINLAPPGHARGTPMITAFVDPWAGRVFEIRNPRDFTLGETILAWQHAIHAGDGFGWPWRLLVFVSGILPALFAGTGIGLWALRRARRAATPLQK